MEKNVGNITIIFFVLFLYNTGFLHAQPEPIDPINRELLLTIAWQFFYAGLMLLMAVFSWLIAILFRSRAFTFLGFMMFFFIPYFLSIYDSVYTNLGIYNLIDRSILMNSGLIGIVLFYYLFARKFVNLPRNLPILNHILLATTIIIILFTATITFINEIGINLRIGSYVLYSIWILMEIFILIVAIIKGIREARVLLVSALPISVSGLFYLGQMIGVVPSNYPFFIVFQIGSIMFFWALFYWSVKNIAKIRNERQQARDLERLKSRFFANISHEFRTPLTLIIDPVQKVAENLEEGENKKLLQGAHQNSQRLLNLVNQILELTKLEVSAMKLYLVEKNIIPLLYNIIGAFESMADDRNITIDFTTQLDELTIPVDVEKLQKIMNNLISNGIKFTDAGGAVHITAKDNGDMLEVSVQDTGCGIPEEQLPHIFDRFFRTDPANNKSGAGIGLALVKELVNLHKGSIAVVSEVGTGSIFTFQLPKNAAKYQQEDFIGDRTFKGPTVFPMPIFSKVGKDATEGPEEKTLSHLLQKQKQKLLVIEDNDAIRHYIAESLNEHFHTVEARNGEEGIEIALKESPNLIVCDVKMPIKNGYEVVSALKSDMRSSHIPIIMLTAKVGKEDKIKGLEIGVDAYLPKPFDSKELKTRAINLIKQRRLLQERFSSSNFFKIGGAQINAIDQKFLKTLEQTLSAHYMDPQLSVEKLALETGMSLSSLNRKLNGFLGVSANKLIQNYRLRQAKKILQQNRDNISEIAFLTGFGSPSYFVKCFREKYGKTPGELLKEEK